MGWQFTIGVLIFSAGFAKLSTASVNWWFARRLSKRIVVAIHTVNIAFILGYPLLLIVGPGSKQLRLLLAGHDSSVPIAGWLALAAGAAGLCLLTWSTIEFQLYAPPACQTGCESHLIELRRVPGLISWQQTYVGPGPMRRIALMPGNEQFTIDVSTKSYSLPRLPAEWDGLSLVQLTDFHFRGAVTRTYFEAVCDQAAALKPDLFVFTGDLFDDLKLLDWLPDTLGRLTAPRGQYFILGNHDWYLDSPAVRRELERLGWTDLAERCVTLNKHSEPAGQVPPVVLCGDETPWMGTHPDLSSVSAESFRILLSHTPDNITWARRQGIDVMLSGHTHGGQIRLPFLGPVYSPSRFGCRYSAGVFWLDPTLLHVSRGLSGREPIRYNCPPELTKLVLRCGR